MASVLTSLLLLLLLAACAEPPPPAGLVAPAAIADAAGEAGRDGVAPTIAPASARATVAPADAIRSGGNGARLVGLRIAIENAPEGLLDDAGAGVIEVIRRDTGETARLVFVEGALTGHLLQPGPWRLRAIAGQHCGPLDLPVPPGGGPLAAGTLTLRFPPDAGPDAAARLAAALPERADLDRLAGLAAVPGGRVTARPLLEPGMPRGCRHVASAVARPDIDPAYRPLSPREIAELAVLGGVFGAALGAAAAAGSVVFVSGGGGLLLLAL